MTLPDHGGETLRQKLELELDVLPPEGCSCLPEGDASGAAIAGQIAVDGRHHADLEVPSSAACCPDEDGGCVLHRDSGIDDACPFGAFYDHGWVPRIVDVADGRIRVRTYLPDRTALSALVETLKRTTEAFQVRRLTRIDVGEDGGERDTTTLELAGLTETQRRTAIRAVEAGYYETPRQISFEELATDVGISKSALSRRLNAVEAELMRTAFGGAAEPTPA